MNLKFSTLFDLFIVFHFWTWLSMTSALPSQRSIDPMLNSPIEDLRHVYLMHPCTNKEMVQRIFNDFASIIGPKPMGQLESEEAEMDLLYIMVIGKALTLTPNKWYLMFEKIVDQYDASVSFSPERKIFNEKMIQRYLTPDQTKRLNIFSQTIASGLNPNDTKILLRYLYAFSIGYALDLSERDIMSVVEGTNSLQEMANQLEKLSNEQCRRKTSILINPNSHIVYDVIKTLLTERKTRR